MLQGSEAARFFEPGKKGKLSSFIAKPRTFYPAVEARGRQVVFGFSYLQKINKGALTGVWYPPSMEAHLIERLAAGDENILDEFHVEWAAVREFNLLQEAGNQDTIPLSPENMMKSLTQLLRMRGGGVRLVVVTMGRYTEDVGEDELQILDSKLQDKIADFISMLYLEEMSAAESEKWNALAEEGKWNVDAALPDVLCTLGARKLFKPQKAEKALSEVRFLQLLQMLDPKSVRHDVAVGLEIPEAKAKKDWIYLPQKEEKMHSFKTLFSEIFSVFDGLSLGALQGRANAKDRAVPTMQHARGYGDHMKGSMAKNKRSCRELELAREMVFTPQTSMAEAIDAEAVRRTTMDKPMAQDKLDAA